MRKTGIVILVLLVLCAVLIFVDQVLGLGWVKGGLAWLLTPLQRGISTEGPEAGSFWERWQEAGRLQEENRQLREIIDEMRSREIRWR
jgi:cell shape-determining protein MreC